LLSLPFEIISTIFIRSMNPTLPIVCKSLFNQLYYCPEYIKLKFLMMRHESLTNAFEHGVRFRFFNRDLLTSFDRANGAPIPFKNKKIPARLFHPTPTETLEERDALISLLLERGANPDKPKGYPIIKSAQLGRLEMVKQLIAYGADPTLENNMALRVCATRDNKEMVSYFLDELQITPDSETLKVCVKKNLWDMIHILVDHGAVPDASTLS
ncbi:hypothetical protein K501DRAFT_126755, partial [Backusella circina FSU 941]